MVRLPHVALANVRLTHSLYQIKLLMNIGCMARPAFMRKVTGKGLSCIKRVLWSPTRPSVFFVLEELKQADGKSVSVSHNLQV